ncbi:ABC transporter substrate-binding protein [Cryobacterium sp. TMT3-29-2]|uniref:ABC transporter substrate-binding protein n=1 Tax=Cryobacterium sp. TMT3-29-2 TaxID=2555867 RepID=UPI0010739AFA|nr:ABC transporter substrate-binding protein [Cryobacterium sp. TMT3-29-2]TFC87938.1 ABC transporter substrate-binding protein [Cryobacterium sp. TMT3-29-2]
MRAASSSLPVSLIGGLACVLLLSGCTAEAAPPVATPTVAPVVIAPSGDGTVRIGTLFPMTGPAAASGAAQVAGTELAAREITEQGRILGTPIEIVHRDSAVDAATALTDLLARGVDVVLWDATVPMPDDLAAAVLAAPAALLALGDFANGGTPLAASGGFAARLRTLDPGLVDTAGGGEAYDGVVLSALAAARAGDDGAASIRPALDQVSTGAVACASWGECAAALADSQQIAYAGVTGRRS